MDSSRLLGEKTGENGSGRLDHPVESTHHHSGRDVWKSWLGGGFKYFLFSSLFGEMIRVLPAGTLIHCYPYIEPCVLKHLAIHVLHGRSQAISAWDCDF